MPALLFTEFARWEIGPGMNSSHFAILQFGYAIIIGCLIYIFMVHFKFLYKDAIVQFSLAVVIGAGVFFNNLNLDLYFN